ncbi:MAG: nucleotidyltransferase family protein [Ruthenibacterium sp.]
MKIAGIIAEYNPFHSGHAAQIAQLRAAGFDAIVCVCAPSMVQRGTQSIFPTAVRTRAALCGGVDLVLSLPAPFATLSAEGFAAAGVRLIAALGVCDVLAFGTETCNQPLLDAAVNALQSAEFTPKLQNELAKGLPFATARAAAADALCAGSGALLRSPNNILAVEYCKELTCLCAAGQKAPKPLALPRKGTAHDAPITDAAQKIVSASALRTLALAKNAGVAAWQNAVPPACMKIYESAQQAGQLFSPAAFDTAILSRLRGQSLAALQTVRGGTEGLENRLFSAIQTADTLENLYTALKTKRYAHARMRRLVLDAALGYTNDLPKTPPYLHVLGATQTGLAVLSQAKMRASLPLSHALTQLAQTGKQAQSIADAHSAAEDFAALCLQKPMPCGTAYTTKMIREDA